MKEWFNRIVAARLISNQMLIQIIVSIQRAITVQNQKGQAQPEKATCDWISCIVHNHE